VNRQGADRNSQRQEAGAKFGSELRILDHRGSTKTKGAHPWQFARSFVAQARKVRVTGKYSQVIDFADGIASFMPFQS
jgi:hypothetical protein